MAKLLILLPKLGNIVLLLQVLEIIMELKPKLLQFLYIGLYYYAIYNQ